jgi:hypothetical protein
MPSPQTFWPSHRESLRRIGSWELDQSNTQSTEIAKRAADRAFGLRSPHAARCSARESG